ncbi:hypothetical protein LguiB_006151 [Lonicera macranthoides]
MSSIISECEGEGDRANDSEDWANLLVIKWELLGEFVELLGVFCLGDYIPWLGWVDRVNGLFGRVDKVANTIDEFLEDVVRDHLEKDQGESKGGLEKDFVYILLEIQRENMLGFPIQRDTIKALILVMMTIFDIFQRVNSRKSGFSKLKTEASQKKSFAFT